MGIVVRVISYMYDNGILVKIIFFKVVFKFGDELG